MTNLRRRIWKWTAAAVASLLIVLAIGVGLFRLAVPYVPGFRADAEAIAEQALGWPVRIGEIDLQWALLGPELVLRDVQLLAPAFNQPLITATRLEIVFGPMDLFQEGALRPSLIRLHQPTLALERDANGELFLSGYALPASTGNRLEWRELLDLLLQHGRVTVIDGRLHYRDLKLGIDDWLLHLDNVTLASDGETHEFAGSIQPPGAIGEQLRFRIDADGEPSNPEHWTWKLDVTVQEMKLDWWYQQFEWAGPGTLNGAIDMQLRAAGRGLEGMAGGGQLALSNVDLASHEPMMTAGAVTRFDRVALNWEFDYGDERLDLDVRELSVAGPRSTFSDGSFALRTGGDNYPLEVAAARIPLGVLAELAHLLPTRNENQQTLADLRRKLLQFAPNGDLRELVLGLDLAADPSRYRIETRIDGLGVSATEDLPGVSGLSGSLRADERSGRLRLDSEALTVDTAGFFRTPLPVERLRADLSWEKRDDGWHVESHVLEVENPEARASGDLALHIPDSGSPVIEMTATARDADFKARSTWLPVAVMSDELVDWLDHAVLDGHAPEAKLVLRGPLENFPFRDGSGVFDIRFRAEDALVKFSPKWPRIESLSADVHFHNASLDIAVDRAVAEPGLRVLSGRARIADFREPLLDVTSRVEGDVRQGWQFLGASPLAEPLEGLLRNIEVAGPMQVNVKLAIPLKDVAAANVDARAALQGISVHPKALPWQVENLRGELVITEKQVSSERLEGEFTGAPFVAEIVPDDAANPGAYASARVAMQGNTPADAFGDFLPAAWLERLEGRFDWQGRLIAASGEAPLRLELESGLEGVTSGLPVPLDNLPAIAADIVIPDDSHVQVALDARALGHGRLYFVENPSGWNFDRGRLALGGEEPPDVGGESGLLIEGAVGALDAAGWLMLDEQSNGTGGTPLLRALDIEARTLQLGTLELDAQRVRASRAGGGWDVRLEGPAQGLLQVPSLRETRAPWRVRLQKLHLPVSEEEEGERTADNAPDPRELPPLDIDINELVVGPVHLGQVRGLLERTHIGYMTQGLVASTPETVIRLDGRWEYIDGEHYTSIVSTLETDDLGDTLAALGYRGGIDADRGTANVNLAWHASPMGVDRGRLEGNVAFRFFDGSLSEVSPGAGRLLGLLSIAALPRRLTLDFSDFFGKGLHFDELSGDFLVTGGSAYTTNVVLEGPSVSALLVGRTGLVAQDYDQLAIVTPDVSSSLPLAGYLAAGPTVGTALLLLSQLLKSPLSDITQVKYRITGSWEDPVIDRVVPQETP